MAEHRTYKQILSDLTAAKAAWHENSRTMLPDDADEASANIKRLMAELSAAITEGAVPCPKTGEKPHGVKTAKGYEIGSLGAPLRARGDTIEEAVAAWNSGDYYTKE